MLHIHNGDCSAEVLKQSQLAGEHLVWREALLEGPTPAGLADEDWYRVRAGQLAGAHQLDFEKCLNDLRAQAEQLKDFSQHEEVVLWFEHDLYCQLILIYLLDWFSQRDLHNCRLSLVCINGFAGRPDFKGLGELTPAEMSSLFDQRSSVTAQQLQLANTAWDGYCSTDPRRIEQLLKHDTSALPFLHDALQQHLMRFPSTENGLGQVENCALRFIEHGINNFAKLFHQFGEALPTYGFGDLQFWQALIRLMDVSEPLILVDDSSMLNGRLDGIKAVQTNFQLTEIGAQVLAGQQDFINLNGIDEWLGGVHLTSAGQIWRWDASAGQLVG